MVGKRSQLILFAPPELQGLRGGIKVKLIFFNYLLKIGVFNR